METKVSMDLVYAYAVVAYIPFSFFTRNVDELESLAQHVKSDILLT